MCEAVRFNGDGWYFWDEAWADEIGPYSSEEDCKAACKKYADEVMGYFIMKTTLTLENQYGKYTIEVNKTDLSIDQLFEELIDPMLHAMGYAQETIDEYLGRENGS